MNQIQLTEVLCFFDKSGNDLILSRKILKDWFPLVSEDNAFQLGLHRVEQNQLNKLCITFQNESKLQCAIFHKCDVDNYVYGENEYIMSELKNMTGYHSVKMPSMQYRGRYKTDHSFIPLRHNMEYRLFFTQFDHLRDFMVGENIAAFIFQNGVPKDIPKETETVMISDSYLENLDFLRDIENLKSLVIERCVVGNWEYLRQLDKLENLHLETVDPPDSSVVQNLVKLKRLSLVDCNLVEIEGLSGKADLKFCDLSDNHELETIDSLETSVELRWLSLEMTSIESLNLSFWERLNILELFFNCMKRLINLSYCQELKLLDYTLNWFDASTMRNIIRLVNKNNLIAIDVMEDLDPIEGLN